MTPPGGAVHGDVPDDYRIVWKCLVEVVAVEQAPVRHDVLVIAVGLDDLTLRNLLGIAVLHEFGDDAHLDYSYQP